MGRWVQGWVPFFNTLAQAWQKCSLFHFVPLISMIVKWEAECQKKKKSGTWGVEEWKQNGGKVQVERKNKSGGRNQTQLKWFRKKCHNIKKEIVMKMARKSEREKILEKDDITRDWMINSASFFTVTSSVFLVRFRMDMKIILLINWQNRSLNTQKQTNPTMLCQAE